VSDPRRAAAVDIGSTSVHLLVADVSPAGVRPIVDQSELLGLGGRIQAHGFLGSDARNELATTLAGYADDARRLGAELIAFVGTDPLRHAADAARACHQIELVSRVPVHVLEQSEEGALTLLGVTDGAPHGHMSVIDIGGGSTEIVLAGPNGIETVVGIPLGASRLSATIGAGDPPSPTQVAALRREADRVLAAAPDLDLGEVVAVGGTAYGVARVATGPGDGERLIDLEGIALAVAVSGRERAGQVAELFGLNPRRARIMPAGAAILAAIAARYRIDRIRASEQGIREGLVRALIRDGRGWRDRLAADRPGRVPVSPRGVDAA
jgi:exopolyphosphatase/guanosine-5'-triphosphate,3'-diphosphate pyrophosphatase